MWERTSGGMERGEGGQRWSGAWGVTITVSRSIILSTSFDPNVSARLKASPRSSSSISSWERSALGWKGLSS